jgi:uncharacterized protein YndB with AHSA1/START domain
MKTPSIEMHVTLKETPAAVFAALTESRIISKWSGQKGSVAPKVGGKFEMFDGWVSGKVLAFKPGVKLAYTWLPTDWPEHTEASTVKYEFETARGGTRITLTHTGFPNAQQMKEHEAGWTENVFDPLKEYFEAK